MLSEIYAKLHVSRFSHFGAAHAGAGAAAAPAALSVPT